MSCTLLLYTVQKGYHFMGAGCCEVLCHRSLSSAFPKNDTKTRKGLSPTYNRTFLCVLMSYHHMPQTTFGFANYRKRGIISRHSQSPGSRKAEKGPPSFQQHFVPFYGRGNLSSEIRYVKKKNLIYVSFSFLIIYNTATLH